MSDNQHRPVHSSELDAAGYDAPGIGRGSGMTLKEILRKVKGFFKDPKRAKEQAHFGWTPLRVRQRQLRAEEIKNEQLKVKKAAERIEFQSHRQHVAAGGVKKFRVSSTDPWEKL